MNAEIHEELQAKGQALILAALEFWQVHRQLAGPRAVVWLEDTSGHLIVFTRGEYRGQLFSNIHPLSGETPLEDPFTV